MPTAARTDQQTDPAGSTPDDGPAFTWLSAGDFQRLTPAMKDEYVRQIAENFGLAAEAETRNPRAGSDLPPAQTG